jgi:hypothetical protein
MVEALEVGGCLLQDRKRSNQQRVRAGGGGPLQEGGGQCTLGVVEGVYVYLGGY